MSAPASAGGRTQPLDTRRRVIVGVLVTLVAAILGLNLVALKVAIAASDPVTVQAFGVALSTLAFFAAAAVGGSPMRLERRHARAVVGVAISLTAGSSLGIAFGVQRVDAGVASLLVSTTPIITLVLEYLMTRERHTWHGIVGVAAGFAGVAVVAVGEQRGGGASQALGVLYMVLGSFGWSLGLVLMRTHGAGAARSTLLAWQFLLATPLLLFVGWWTTGLHAEWSALFVGAIAYSGFMAKGVSFFLQLTVVRLGNAVHASLTAFLMPVFGTLAGVLLLGEAVEPSQLLGAVAILGGVLLVLRARVLVNDEAVVPTA